jgi:hypothetical protein
MINTKQATSSINHIIDDFDSATKSMVTNAESVSSVVNESKGTVELFDRNFARFAEIASKTHESVTYAEVISNASLIKMDHMIYMQNAYRAPSLGKGSAEWTAVEVDHHSCRFGKWYDGGMGDKLFRHLPSYSSLDKPHKLVHSTCFHALSIAEQDWQHNADLCKELVATYQKAENSSRQLINIVTDLVAEKNKFETTDEATEAEIDFF